MGIDKQYMQKRQYNVYSMCKAANNSFYLIGQSKSEAGCHTKVLLDMQHFVQPQLGFNWTFANFGRPLSDVRLLFAALYVYYNLWGNQFL